MMTTYEVLEILPKIMFDDKGRSTNLEFFFNKFWLKSTATFDQVLKNISVGYEYRIIEEPKLELTINLIGKIIKKKGTNIYRSIVGVNIDDNIILLDNIDVKLDKFIQDYTICEDEHI